MAIDKHSKMKYLNIGAGIENGLEIKQKMPFPEEQRHLI